MATYLLTWSPATGTNWPTISEDAQRLRQGRKLREPADWSVGVRRSVEPNSDVFLIRLGKDRPGLVSHGWIKGDVYPAEHWDVDKAEEGEMAYYVDFDPDYIVDIENEAPLDIRYTSVPELRKLAENLRRGLQGSGIEIHEPAATRLHELWNEFIGDAARIREEMPAEPASGETFPEGGRMRIVVNRYERDGTARRKCLEHYGYRCVVCDMSFADRYGEQFASIIQVHHLTKISEIGEEYDVNPIKDLRPVCPNCHAALHAPGVEVTVEELREILVGRLNR